ncbi:MAG: CBS domain-containing protein [Beijerinckiaceae bacterium]
MTVARILGDKGQNVFSITPDGSLQDAARTLADRRIGAVIITTSDGALAGILSERDIVRAVARNGSAALSDSVAQHMTRDVVTCGRSTTIDQVMATMTAGKFRHIPVVEDGRLTGVVSIGDVVKHRVAAMEAESEALKNYIASS